MTDDPIIPDLAENPDEPAGDLADLPVSEPLVAPVPPDERETRPQAPPPLDIGQIAAQNGAGRPAPGAHNPDVAGFVYPKTPPAPPVQREQVGAWQMFGAIQSDLEQLHAEATSTRRATQLLALSIAAAAALVIVYAVRAARTPAPVSK